MECQICGKELSFQWSDTHGVGVCISCGLPYTIFHYDEHKVFVEKPPDVAIKAEWIEVGKRYWQETKRRVFPGSYDWGFFGHRDRTYSGATEDDYRSWNEWLEKHEAELPKDEEEGSGSRDAEKVNALP